jgi:hypothetical protein
MTRSLPAAPLPVLPVPPPPASRKRLWTVAADSDDDDDEDDDSIIIAPGPKLARPSPPHERMMSLPFAPALLGGLYGCTHAVAALPSPSSTSSSSSSSSRPRLGPLKPEHVFDSARDSAAAIAAHYAKHGFVVVRALTPRNAKPTSRPKSRRFCSSSRGSSCSSCAIRRLAKS